MSLKKYITNLSALQTINLLRFITFFIISIVLVKAGYSKSQIGEFEMTIFLANAVSFFWVYGIIQSLMPLYNNNNSFLNTTRNRKSPEIFNAFILLLGFSLLLFILFSILKNHVNVFGNGIDKIPNITIFLLYLLLSNPSSLIEYVYVLRKKPIKTLTYGFLTYSTILISVSFPLILGFDIRIALWCLVITSALRFVWLVALLKKYAELKISMVFIKEHLQLALPLIISSLLSGSAEYIDNLVISIKFDPETFAVFRYGAKELPFVSTMAYGLSSAMLVGFSTQEKVQKSVIELKQKSKKLMHLLFPITIVVLLFANIIYPAIFSIEFKRSADIFMVYLLLITSRLLFPHTILIGLKQTKIVLTASVIAIILNIALSLILIPYYGTVGVALATVGVYFVEKIVLMWFTYIHYGIKPIEYTPIFTYLIYSTILEIIFVLIDHRIINIYLYK